MLSKDQIVRKRDLIFHVEFLILYVTIFVIAGLTFFYSYDTAGSFNFSPDLNVYSNAIQISDNSDFEIINQSLDVEHYIDVTTTYHELNIRDVLKSDGMYENDDDSFLAYSFYIKNTGTKSISVGYSLSFTEIINQLDDYVKIVIIEDDQVYQMYSKNTDNQEVDIHINQFDDMTIVFSEVLYDFKPNQVKLFRIIIWFDEHTLIDDDLNGSLSLEFAFSILKDEYQVVNKDDLSFDGDKLWFTITDVCYANIEVHFRKPKQ